MNILFVCSKNQWRSPTGEEMYKNHPEYQVKSAGTEAGARIRVTAKLLGWADVVFVMEKKHKNRLTEKFPEEARSRQIVVLDIEDNYRFMDDELVEMIKVSVDAYLDPG